MSGRDKRSKANGQKFKNKKQQDFSWQTPTTATPVPREIPNGHKKNRGKTVSVTALGFEAWHKM